MANRFDYWMVTGIPLKTPDNYRGLLMDRTPERRILQYPEIRDELSNFTDVVLYGVTFDPDRGEPSITEMHSPEFTVENQTIYLENGTMLHPRQQMGYYTPYVNAFGVKHFGRRWYIVNVDQLANTVAIDEKGNRNSLFELTEGEYQTFTISSNVELTSSRWSYTLPLLAMIRVSRKKHVAICIDGDEIKAFILEEPLTLGSFEIEVRERNNRREAVVRHPVPNVSAVIG